MIPKKKLIEVALPLDAINRASVREGFIYRGNPSAVHKWWAQRPLAAARAVIFAQMVDDPSAHPDLFPTQQEQEKERQRLFEIMEDLVIWENISNHEVLQRARDEIWQSWRQTCAENVDHPRALELFDRYRLPGFYDPFVGGGTLALEAQRLGLETFASDLNPVAVLITKALTEFPPKFAGQAPVNPTAHQAKTLIARDWDGAQGLAEDVRYYGQWMRDEATKRIGHLYPNVTVPKEQGGGEATVIAWLWARTVTCPNPACGAQMPLVKSFWLSRKKGKETWVEPVPNPAEKRVDFRIASGKGQPPEPPKLGRGARFRCLVCGETSSERHVKDEGAAGRMGAQMLAIVAEGAHGRIYLPPLDDHKSIAASAKPTWKPEADLPGDRRAFWTPAYGLTTFGDLFTPRQLMALTTFSDLVQEAHNRVVCDALSAGLCDDRKPLMDGGTGASAYGDAVATLLAFSADKTAEYGCTIVPWYTKEDRPKGLFARHAIPMVWDYAEVNPLANIGGTFAASVNIVASSLTGCPADDICATVRQLDAIAAQPPSFSVVSTDPPYYDNIGYADLSDFFYVWLRRSLKSFFPDLFATMAVPKAEELVATPYRHGGKEKAEAFFLDGMTQAMSRLAEHAHPAFPVTIYYAFKQSETESDGAGGVSSTGWDTFLGAVIRAGFAITGTWPMRTERGARSIGLETNALASSIVLVCRPRASDAPSATRREFVSALKTELPVALAQLQRGNIAPVDLAQAAIGPGIAVFTRYSQVLDAEGKPLSVRDALALINETLDEVLAEQEGDFDADSRWALAWFDGHGFGDGPFGDAHTYFLRYNTAENALKQAGIIESGRGKVRLLGPDELAANWDPTTDPRLTAWEMVHHLVRVLEVGGESAAATIVAKLGAKAEIARELAYRLYTVCDRNKRAAEALSYNGLVQSWPEITRLAHDLRNSTVEQGTLFGNA